VDKDWRALFERAISEDRCETFPDPAARPAMKRHDAAPGDQISEKRPALADKPNQFSPVPSISAARAR
jgi:hypothetical protein